MAYIVWTGGLIKCSESPNYITFDWQTLVRKWQDTSMSLKIFFPIKIDILQSYLRKKISRPVIMTSLLDESPKGENSGAANDW